jgi:hypothetical protein
VIEGLESRAYLSGDLTATISVVSPASRQVKPGQSFTVAIDVTNAGATAATGSLTSVVGASTSSSGSSPVDSGTIHDNIHLAAGAHIIIKVVKKVPAGFTPGTYYAVADVDTADTFGAPILAVSANTLAVLSPYPNLLGTWSGSGVVKKGDDKGLVFSHTDHFTSENDATGAFTFTGTNSFPNGTSSNFAGSGTVTTKGAISETSEAVPANDTGVTTVKGKVAGSKLSVTFSNAFSSGTEALTRSV